MAGLKFKIHPLFIIFGIVFAVIGNIFVFIIYTLTAVIHEFGHMIYAQKLGYKINSLTLMPYGCVLDASISGLKLKDEAAFALGGPLLNLIIAIIFIALWWIQPETYAFTQVIVTANLTIGIINLLPAYPLDGGRIIFSLLGQRYGEKVAARTVKILGAVFLSALVALFVFTAFNKPNFSILLFAVFILLGLCQKPREPNYIRIFNLSQKRFERDARIKKYAVSTTITIKKIIALIDADCFCEIAVFDKSGYQIAHYSHKELVDLINNANIYEQIDKYIE